MKPSILGNENTRSHRGHRGKNTCREAEPETRSSEVKGRSTQIRHAADIK